LISRPPRSAPPPDPGDRQYVQCGRPVRRRRDGRGRRPPPRAPHALAWCGGRRRRL